MEDDGRQLRVTAVHPNGRRTFDPASKAGLIESCLRPGASVAQLALAAGVNANLLWKWIRQHRLAMQATVKTVPPSTSAFIPVEIDRAADQAMSRQRSAFALDFTATRGGVAQSASAQLGRLSSPVKVNASFPNGVKLTVENVDFDALAAMIGALGHVQTGG